MTPYLRSLPPHLRYYALRNLIAEAIHLARAEAREFRVSVDAIIASWHPPPPS